MNEILWDYGKGSTCLSLKVLEGVLKHTAVSKWKFTEKTKENNRIPNRRDNLSKNTKKNILYKYICQI